MTAALVRWRELLNVDQITVVRRGVRPWERAEIDRLRAAGVRVHVTAGHDQRPAPDLQAPGSSLRPHYLFHAGPNGSGLARRERYASLAGLRGAVAQGSEWGFGPSFMAGVEPERLRGERFVHVVSCNTHGLASVLRWIAGPRLEHLLTADAVAVRRSEDLGQHTRRVGGPVVARHRDPLAGTHHAADVRALFDTIGVNAPVTSSDVTTEGQLLHTLRFRVRLSKRIDEAALRARLAASPWLATTSRFDGNQVFEIGRRHGFHGRLYSHAVVVENNLLIDGDTVSGWAFVPQEGNTIGSTLAAFLWQTEHPQAAEVIETIRRELVIPVV